MTSVISAHQLAILQTHVLDCASHRKGTSVLFAVLIGLDCSAHDSTFSGNQKNN